MSNLPLCPYDAAPRETPEARRERLLRLQRRENNLLLLIMFALGLIIGAGCATLCK